MAIEQPLLAAQTKKELPPSRCMIVGLGNPGKRYRQTRHNIGFMLADAFAKKHHISLGKVKNRAIMGEGQILLPNSPALPLVIAKPQTFMNISGESVGALARFYKLPAWRILIIYDELDLPFGALRLRPKGGAGGHNGMKSIINHLGNDFPRMRLGIGRPPGRMPASAYVLQKFNEVELEVVDEMANAGISAIETWLSAGIELAMSRHNKKAELE